MNALRLRPEAIRVSWQAIGAFALVLYVVRSALRSWDFRPDVLDAVVFGGLAVVLLARPLVARLLSNDEEEGTGPEA